MESLVGVDYLSLLQNEDFELMPKKLPYKQKVGVCVNAEDSANDASKCGQDGPCFELPVEESRQCLQTCN